MLPLERATGDNATVLANRWDQTRRLALSETWHATHLGGFSLWSRARGVRDLVAYGAGFASFERAVEAARQKKIPTSPSIWLRELGRVSFQMPAEDYAEVALAFYQAALRANAGMVFRDVDSLAYLEATLRKWGADAAAREVPRHQRWAPIEVSFFRVDLAGAKYGYGSLEWLRTLNREVFESAGLRAIELSNSGRTSFDKLGAREAAKINDGPLISVIMSTFRRRDEIRVSVRSILEQTWQNLELIIVDDASGDDYASLYDELAAMDDRISVIKLGANGGAYVARNAALRRARGDYVTFQDDDDWSHPERLEHQVAALIHDQDVALTLSMSARVQDGLSFRHRANPVVRRNVSSVMFRLGDVIRVGYFDTVRKAADSEFIERLLLVTRGREEVIDKVLAFVRLSTGSLSRTDFSAGWHHPARVEYRESYRAYHTELQHSQAPDSCPDGMRRFPAPRRFLEVQVARDTPSVVDALYLGDWRDMGPSTAAMAQHFEDLADSQRRVGIAHTADVRLSGRFQDPIAPSIRRLISAGKAVRVLPTDDIEVETLVVDDAGIVESLSDGDWTCTVKSVQLTAPDLPAELEPTSSWAVGRVLSDVTVKFGPKEVSWRTKTPEVKDGLCGLGLEVSDVDLRGAAVGVPKHRRVALARALPRVGAYMPRGQVLGSDVSKVLREMSTGRLIDVRLYTGVGVRGEHVANRHVTWLAQGPADTSYGEYLAQLDFLLLSSTSAYPEDQVLAACQAVASGCMVIADPLLEPVLADAAVYCGPEDAQAWILGLHGNSTERSIQAERGQAWGKRLRAEYLNNLRDDKRDGTV